MGGCAAIDCSNHSWKGNRLVKFPKNEERRKIWVNNCQKDNWEPGQSAELCLIGPKYVKLKSSLHLASHRLKILQSKKLELVEKLKKEVAKYLMKGKYMQARIKAERIVRDEVTVEAMELTEMFCDQWLQRYELFEQMREPDVSLITPISSLIWIVPYYQTQIRELKVILKQLVVKYGSKFCRKALRNETGNVSHELIDRVRLPKVSDEKIETCLTNICMQYNVTYYQKEANCRNDNYPGNQAECKENTDRINEAKPEDTQSKNDVKLFSNKIGFMKDMLKFTNLKSFREKKGEEGEDETSRKDEVSNNKLLETSSWENMKKNYETKERLFSSRDKLDDSVSASDDSLNQENFKTEEANRNFDTARNFSSPLVSSVLTDCCSHIYEEPPPPYSYNYISYTNWETDTNQEMSHYFDAYQLPPTCPSEIPGCHSSPEDVSAKRKDKN